MTEGVADFRSGSRAGPVRCRECDLIQFGPEVDNRATAHCRRCGGHLYRSLANSLDRTVALRIAAMILLVAANTFLELERARAILDIQERNRELTARNLATTKARIAAGWSSEREVLRWESQLAMNDTDIVRAHTQVLVNRFELNRVRNQPTEAPIAPLPVRIEEYGFVYARERIAEAISEPEGDHRLRDLLVRVGLDRSPELAALDAAGVAGVARTYG